MEYRIKEIREEKGITQEELAKLSGVSRGTIAALESKTVRATTTKTLLNIANALETTVESIFFTSGV